MDSSILIIGGGVALGAFVLGSILLAVYLRSNRAKAAYGSDPMVYGNLVMCPNCGYMNPLDTAACLKCRVPLPARPPQGYGFPPPPPPAQPGGMPPAPDYGGYAPPPPKPDYGAYAAPPPPPAAPPKPTYTPQPGYGNYAAPPPAYAPDPDQTGAPASPNVPAAAPSVMPGAMPRAWLEGVSGAVVGHRAYLSQASILVGRSTQCDVQVYDPKVSRRHFQIRFANGGFFLQDQQSSRGTRVNGERVMARRLNDGDRIELGDSSLIFHLEA
ncbi:MAG TPA: FHA domain-containing protein [Aggregatilineaceae bacterium]|nr:FHA domain-containing protein [Aggregatilineaceae bacterium]